MYLEISSNSHNLRYHPWLFKPKIFKTVAKEGWQKILNFARSQQTEGRTMISNVHFFENSFLLLLETVDVTRINK